MWDKIFANAIFKSLKKISSNSYNECFKASFNGKNYFVKKITMRLGENFEKAKKRIEYTEKINFFFHQNGLSTILPIFSRESCCHIDNENIWIAYPWVELHVPDFTQEKICFKLGQFLSNLHLISQKIGSDENDFAYKLPDFSWEKNRSHDLALFLCQLTLLKDLANYGYKCSCYLYEISPMYLAHCDMHINNIAIRNDSFVLLDWEQSGPTHLIVDLFDTALNLCGFCKAQTNTKLFKSIIDGYYSHSTNKNDENSSKCAIGILYLIIIEHMSYLLNEYIKDNDREKLEKAKEFLTQVFELKKHEDEFLNILTNRESDNCVTY